MSIPSWLITSIGGALLATGIAGCAGGDTYVLATITRGNVPTTSPIRSLETTIDLDGRIDMTPRLSPSAGAEMELPATLSLELGSGEGLAVVGATAYGDGGALLAMGSTEVMIAAGDITPVTIDLGRDEPLPDPCIISADRTSIIFGSLTLGNMLDATVTVGNSGFGSCQPLMPTRVGNFADQFVFFDDNCTGVALGVGSEATCTFGVRFLPQDVGSFGATIGLKPYEQGANAAVGVSGNAVLFSLTPSSLGFGNVAVGSNVIRSVTVKNESTTTATQAVGLLVDDSNNYAIDSSSTCTQAQTLAPGETCVIRVRFNPGSPGPHNTSLHVTDRATMSLAVSGTGT